MYLYLAMNVNLTKMAYDMCKNTSKPMELSV